MQRVILIGTAVILSGLVALFAAFDRASAQSSDGANPYGIGFISDFSGPLAAYGKSLRGGFDAHIAAVNSGGGIAGRKIAVTYMDDGSQPDRSAADFTNLSSGNLAVASGILSNTCNAMEPLAAERKVALLCYAAGGDLIKPARPYLFVSFLQSIDMARPSIEFAQSIVPNKVVRTAVITLSVAAASAWGDAVAAIARKAGWTVDRQSLDMKDANPMPQLEKIALAKPDVIFINTLDAQVVKLSQALAQADINPPVVITGGGVSLATLKSLQENQLYQMTPYLYVDPNTAGDAAPLRSYLGETKTADVDPNGAFTAPGFLEAQLIVQALRSCGEGCTAERLRDSLDHVQIQTAVSANEKAGFTPADHQAVSSVSLYRWNAKSSAMTKAAGGLALGSQ